MAWSYIKLWKLLLDKGMKRIDLAAAANLTSNTLAKLGKDKEVSMETLNKICNQLDCGIEDILEHIPD
ncbi:helix-turn-helix domain-containing protein [Butyricicoccus sp. AM27-36]|uniref:helix-turn-helix domain-containing protein n=1 Tax=Butyricicoccus sp. AM27-36 TaxID=2292293 RepID=UPI000E495F14|nr:helix-turn-helix transcriptional regulator [Butyricicoccus sp. AM27-36]RHT89994.1 XRE family transcriptional regulator [Butyricicoccus sp. AM27-36]